MSDDIFKDLSDLPVSKSQRRERNLQKELFGTRDPDKIIDEFERQLGYPKKDEKPNYKYKNRIFNANHDVDQELMNELLNDKDKFEIILWKDTWTVHGDFKVFVIYAEKQLGKKEEEETNE